MNNSDGKYVLFNSFQVLTIRTENIAVQIKSKNFVLAGFSLGVGRWNKRKIVYSINAMEKKGRKRGIENCSRGIVVLNKAFG